MASLSGDAQAANKRVASVELIEGYPAEAILKRANELDCAMIVMGAHEHGPGHTFLGTAAKRVMRRSFLIFTPRNRGVNRLATVSFAERTSRAGISLQTMDPEAARTAGRTFATAAR